MDFADLEVLITIVYEFIQQKRENDKPLFASPDALIDELLSVSCIVLMACGISP